MVQRREPPPQRAPRMPQAKRWGKNKQSHTVDTRTAPAWALAIPSVSPDATVNDTMPNDIQKISQSAASVTQPNENTQQSSTAPPLVRIPHLRMSDLITLLCDASGRVCPDVLAEITRRDEQQMVILRQSEASRHKYCRFLARSRNATNRS